MDANVPKIRPRDVELARIQDNLANALQGVLDQASGAQPASQIELSPVMTQPRGPGTPMQLSKLALKIHGDTSQKFTSRNYTVEIGDVATSAVPQRDVQLGFWGRIILWGQKLAPDPFVIVPGVTGVTFRTTDVNAVTKVTIDDQGNLATPGSVSAASVVSSAGFKTWLPPMSYWNPAFPGGLFPLVAPVVQSANGVASTVPWGMPMPRAGSITAVTVAHFGTAGFVCAVALSKNGTQFYSANISNNTATGYVALAKGAQPFAAGDYLSAKITYSVANVNVCTTVAIEVEEAA